MENDAWLFVGIFALIFIIWIATGGPEHPISFAGPTVSASTTLTGGGSYLSLPKAPYTLGGTDVVLPGSSNGEGSAGVSAEGSSAVGVPSASSLSGVGFGTPSPYRGIVTMSHYVSGAGSVNPDDEYVEISVSQNANVPVDLTGWRLESAASGNAATIPAGSPLPTSGIVESVADIVLTAGQNAIVVSGQSPIGASFRENECIGYFAQFQPFDPSLPLDCPEPSAELAVDYPDYIRDNSCVNYVSTLSRCQAVLTPPTTVSGACQAFIVNTLNYNSCVQAHQSDADFLGNTWRVYLGRTTPLWRTQNEVVKLVDNNGDTVDAFSY